MKLIRLFQYIDNIKINFHNILSNYYINHIYQFSPIIVTNNSYIDNKERNDSSIFDNFLWFAAPKSKISPARKREKHKRFYPQRLDWVQCERCGESKLPHRMCSTNAEICAMRPEDYEVYKRNLGKI